MSFSRGFSQIPRNRLHGCFRWFLSQQQYHLRSLLSNRFQSPSDFTRKVLGCREIYSWGLLALHVFQRQIHHEHNSIIEEELDPFSLVAEELSIFANRLRSMVVAEVPKFASAAEYFFKMSVEGKRFRPTVLLLMATALNGNIPEYDSIKVGESVTSDLRMQQQNVAEITEMIHVASLIHNDVLDDVDTRSEIGSLNFVMGNKAHQLPSERVLFLRHGIVTAPILFAIEEFPQLRAAVDRGFKSPADVDLVLDYLGKSRGIQKTRELATKHANLAAAAIDSLPESNNEDVLRSRRALVDLTHRVIKRTQ